PAADVGLAERHLDAEPVHQRAEVERDVVGIGAGAELTGQLALAHDPGDQLALAAVEARIGGSHPGVAPRPQPDLEPERPVAALALPGARHLDELDELRRRAVAAL